MTKSCLGRRHVRARGSGRADHRGLLTMLLVLVAIGTSTAAFAADTPNGVAGGFCVAVVALASARHLSTSRRLAQRDTATAAPSVDVAWCTPCRPSRTNALMSPRAESPIQVRTNVFRARLHDAGKAS